jgi:pantetheine-phosphate adenylyltransferase
VTRRRSRPSARAPVAARRSPGGTAPAPRAAASGLRVAVYPGSFDPVTRGHEDLIGRALTFADRVIVAVAVNVAKQPLFTLDERVALLRQAVDRPEVEVRAFDGLLADFARAAGAAVIVRGLRAVSDFEYEFQMALMNRNLAPGIETVFLVPAFDLTYLSSSLVREVARFGGDVSALVHPAVQRALRHKFAK